MKGKVVQLSQDTVELPLEIAGKSLHEFWPDSTTQERTDEGTVVRGERDGVSLRVQMLADSPRLTLRVTIAPTSGSPKVKYTKTAKWSLLDLENKTAPTLLTGAETELKSSVTFTTFSVLDRPRVSKEPRRLASLTIEGNPVDNAALQNMMFALKKGYSPELPVAPFGSTSARFEGHVFWDADMWVFPYAALCDKQLAQSIAAYRLSQLPTAEQNFKAWFAAGMPVAEKGRHIPVPELRAKLTAAAAKFPWESDANGVEAAPSDTVHEEFVTGAVAWMLDQAAQSNLVTREAADGAIKQCAAYYLSRMSKLSDGTYGITRVVSPSEWHTADNDLFTNAIADWTLCRALGEPWAKANLMRFPKRGDTFGTFDGDDRKQYQQAAALLAVYPLNHRFVAPDAVNMVKLYGGKNSPSGPAMSSAIVAGACLRGHDPELAYSFWKGPDGLELIEKPGGDSYFLTGAAGYVNVVLNGFLGINIYDRAALGGYSKKLKNGSFLTIVPQLPKEWTAIRAHDVWLGEGYGDVSATHEAVTVTLEGQEPQTFSLRH